jgi:hypothetical protein
VPASGLLGYHLCMHATSGTVVDGKIVVEGLNLPNGTKVTVWAPGDEDAAALPEALERELLDALDEADREIGGAGPDFIDGLRRFG